VQEILQRERRKRVYLQAGEKEVAHEERVENEVRERNEITAGSNPPGASIVERKNRDSSAGNVQ